MRSTTLAAALIAGVFAAAPALGQGRGGPSDRSPAPPPATGANAFQAPAGSPLASRHGRPLWEVYSDCAWANFNAYKALIKAESERDARDRAADQAYAARQANPNTVSLSGPLIGLDNVAARNAQRARDLQTRQALSSRSDALTAKAVDAYAAQTGQPREAVKAWVQKADAVAILTVDQCKVLAP